MDVYVQTQGAKIHRQGERLQVRHEGRELSVILAKDLSQLFIYGNVEITAPVRNLLLRKNIDTVFMSASGTYRGRLHIGEGKNVPLRLKQYRCLSDKGFTRQLCRQFVSGKLTSMAVLLERIACRRNRQQAHTRAKDIGALFPQLHSAMSVNSIRGYEGRGSAIYFSTYRYGFINDPGFRKRLRRPPPDPVNGGLSLMYWFLYNTVYAALVAKGLDPALGFLHTPEYGRQSLVLDMMEEFRVVICDTTVLCLFNKGLLKASDFSLANNRFSKDAFKKITGQYHKRLDTEFTHPASGVRMSYRKAIVEQAGSLRECIEGKGAYQPVTLR